MKKTLLKYSEALLFLIGFSFLTGFGFQMLEGTFFFSIALLLIGTLSLTLYLTRRRSSQVRKALTQINDTENQLKDKPLPLRKKSENIYEPQQIPNLIQETQGDSNADTKETH